MKCESVLEDIELALSHGLVEEIGIPACPSLLTAIQAELSTPDPKLQTLARLACADVAASATLVRAANSQWRCLLRPAETVESAIQLLGMAQFESIFFEIVMRETLPACGAVTEHFWDMSTKRSQAMSYLARLHLLCPVGVARACGLFLDVGIPLMTLRLKEPSYAGTLAQAAQSDERVTDIEQRRHGTDHALIGASMARIWGVSQTALLALRLHHEHDALGDPRTPPPVRNLMALVLVVEHMIQSHQQLPDSGEWRAAGAAAMRVLGLNQHGLADWTAGVHALFDASR